MLSRSIKFENFKAKKIPKNLLLLYKKLISKKNDNNNLINSFTNSYTLAYDKKLIKKYKKYKSYCIYGMGGSSLGAQAIYDFMKTKIKKSFYFYNNLDKKIKLAKIKKKALNIIISKSGNTLETIVNDNISTNTNKLFITENNNNYLRKVALKLKSEIIEHKNFIGGRYSVLSEVGMLPAELMGLDSKKFKRFNKLILNKLFVKNLLNNVNILFELIKKKKTNSIILNYDESSNSIFRWYQQLVGESLGKKSKGVLPVISEMPKDNHSLMQLYLDGNKNSFFTFFDVLDDKSSKIRSKNIFNEFIYLKKHSVQSVKLAQKQATKTVFSSKNIPYRSFELLKKNEETLGELFTFFMLETILVGNMMKVNPFDQPAVELIKQETKRILY